MFCVSTQSKSKQTPGLLKEAIYLVRNTFRMKLVCVCHAVGESSRVVVASASVGIVCLLAYNSFWIGSFYQLCLWVKIFKKGKFR